MPNSRGILLLHAIKSRFAASELRVKITTKSLEKEKRKEMKTKPANLSLYT
jgi:hypothetical protein